MPVLPAASGSIVFIFLLPLPLKGLQFKARKPVPISVRGRFSEFVQVLFRSLNKLLMDTATSECLFCLMHSEMIYLTGKIVFLVCCPSSSGGDISQLKRPFQTQHEDNVRRLCRSCFGA